MRFSCERCGKRYATADRPPPGRTYRLRCKACGHLLVVTVAAGDAAAPEDGARGPELATARAERELEGDAAGAGQGGEAGGGPAAAPPPLPDATTEVAAPAASETPPPAPPAAAGYVDLFSDVPEAGDREGPGEDAPPAAAGPAGAAAPGAPPGSGPAPERTPGPGVRRTGRHRAPLIPKPQQQRSTLALAMLAIGVLLLAGILAFVAVTSGSAPAAGEGAPPPAAAPPR